MSHTPHGTESTVQELPWIVHWSPRGQFEKPAITVGLTVTAGTDADGKPARGDDTGVVHFRLQAG